MTVFFKGFLPAQGVQSSPRLSRRPLARHERAFLWCACVALLGLRGVAMFTLPLMDTTEARYAEIARIMVESGDWITPQFSLGVPFWGKP
jgi:4-amino-4-deoxy-L-arabinose transferase-like glycosyltransferase